MYTLLLLVLCAILLSASTTAFRHASTTKPRPTVTGARRSYIAMPTLLIQSSQALDATVRDALLRDCSKAVSSCLGKPESYVMISYKKVDGMMFGGSTDPCAFCHLASIGKIGPETNPKMSKTISELLQKHLQGDSLLSVLPTHTLPPSPSPSLHPLL